MSLFSYEPFVSIPANGSAPCSIHPCAYHADVSSITRAGMSAARVGTREAIAYSEAFGVLCKSQLHSDCAHVASSSTCGAAMGIDVADVGAQGHFYGLDLTVI